jgi:hypothetical protein
MARAQSSIKVHESPKEKVRCAALMAGLKQSELVERAIDEYVERHHEEFQRRMERAQEALLGGKASTLAYATGASEEQLAHVGGGASDQVSSRKTKRATSNQASSPAGASARGSQTSASAASSTRRKSTSRSRSSTKRPSAA